MNRQNNPETCLVFRGFVIEATYVQRTAEKVRAQQSRCKKIRLSVRTGMFNPDEAKYACMPNLVQRLVVRPDSVLAAPSRARWVRPWGRLPR